MHNGTERRKTLTGGCLRFAALIGNVLWVNPCTHYDCWRARLFEPTADLSYLHRYFYVWCGNIFAIATQ